MRLLTSLNIDSNRTEKLGNWIGMIYYIVLSKTRKIKLVQWKYLTLFQKIITIHLN